MPRRKMTEEQKKAASERLAKAREKRLRENPPKYSNVHPSVCLLYTSPSPRDATLSRMPSSA